jgi:heterodisulfide reductase subunit B
MKYLYYPGCSLKSTGRAYEESILAVFRALDVPLVELNDWNCCGATSYVSIDEEEAFTLAARNLALAESEGSHNGEDISLVAPCSACFLVLTKTQRYLEMYPNVNRDVTAGLEAGGLRYTGKVKVRHPLDVLINDIGIQAIAKAVKRPLKGMKVACYYGCQIVRPFATFDHAQYPTTMDTLVKIVGAEPVDWPLKTRCCGGSLTGTIQEAGLRLNRALLKEGIKRKADVMITCCPLCQHNLECYQDRINRLFSEDLHLPIAYFTQLMGVAFGIDEKTLAMRRLFVKPTFTPVRKEGEPAHV